MVAVPNAADVFAVEVVGEDVGLGLEAELAEEVELAVGVGVELAVGVETEVVELVEGVGAGLDLVKVLLSFEVARSKSNSNHPFPARNST